MASGKNLVARNVAEASGSRTHRRQENLPPAGFEDREDHRSPCASIELRSRRFHVSGSDEVVHRRARRRGVRESIFWWRGSRCGTLIFRCMPRQSCIRSRSGRISTCGLRVEGIPTSRKRREKWGTLLFLASGYFGCGTMRMYGLGDFQPPGYCFWASSLDTLPLMMTSSPGFQFAGVETLCLAVSWMESSTRNKLVEVAAGAHGIAELELYFLIRAHHKDGTDSGIVGGGAAFGRLPLSAGNMP